MKKPTCETCPYYLKWRLNEAYGGNDGECRLKQSRVPKTKHFWCGNHPDFSNWIEDYQQREIRQHLSWDKPPEARTYSIRLIGSPKFGYVGPKSGQKGAIPMFSEDKGYIAHFETIDRVYQETENWPAYLKWTVTYSETDQ